MLVYYDPLSERIFLATAVSWCWVWTYDGVHYQKYGFSPQWHGCIYLGDL